MASTSVRLNPYRSHTEWGRVIVGGVVLPGSVVSIDGARKPHQWAIQMGIQVSNAVTVWRGKKLAEAIKIVCNLYNQVEFDKWYDVQAVLDPPSGKKPPSVSIVNAHINFARITRVSCIYVDPPTPTKGLSWLGELSVIEYNPPKPAKVGPADPPKVKTENDRLADELDAAMAQARKLP